MQLIPADHTMATRHATDSAKTLDPFITTRFQTDAMLKRLKALSNARFKTHPDEIKWGDVGTLNHCASLLRQISGSTLKEGGNAA